MKPLQLSEELENLECIVLGTERSVQQITRLLRRVGMNIPQFQVRPLTVTCDHPDTLLDSSKIHTVSVSIDNDLIPKRDVLQQYVNTMLNVSQHKIQTLPYNSTKESHSSHRTAQQIDLQTLSRREQEVFHLIGHGYGNSEIAQELGISVKTVETHRNNIMRKTDTSTASELRKAAVEKYRNR